MNRTLIFGIAIFFAIVGIALIGGSNKAVAGHGCCGCHSCARCGTVLYTTRDLRAEMPCASSSCSMNFEFGTY